MKSQKKFNILWKITTKTLSHQILTIKVINAISSKFWQKRNHVQKRRFKPQVDSKFAKSNYVRPYFIRS